MSKGKEKEYRLSQLFCNSKLNRDFPILKVAELAVPDRNYMLTYSHLKLRPHTFAWSPNPKMCRTE